MLLMWLIYLLNSFLTLLSANTVVLILARGGSKGIRLKNLQTVARESLICRAVRIAKTAGFYDVTVSTDHPLIALESIKCNSTVYRRSYITATDWAPSIWGVAEFLSTRPDVTTVVLIQATSPFIYPEKIREAVTKLNHPIPYDCVFSVERSFKLRWNHENGKIYPLNFNTQNRPRRQSWAGELVETGAFYITRKELILKGYFQNTKLVYYKVLADARDFVRAVRFFNYPTGTL
ncbi:hypothetical protein K1T71_007008 [Dendrolimus kikuchii]|uniref:Uncharacterized protein n=1 Tax=Dendrolimus kikuchii TaxID=765133 RepID=A0ACC1CZ53_9NEOP|nr:hypothetical protein K1T71_007008 [Dendrolimus kikuchii]